MKKEYRKPNDELMDNMREEREDETSVKKKNKIVTIGKIFLLLLTLILPWTIQERVLADTGSITINLKELGSSKTDVKFKAYEVGAWNSTTGSWELAECLRDTGIELNDLIYASDWDDAALELAKETEALKTLTSVSGATDANGTLTFSNLEWGMYLVIQDGENTYGTVSTFLAALPYTEEGVQKTELTVQPKAEAPLPKGNGRIIVTKRVGKLDSELLEVADIVLLDKVSYYVGLFRDSKGQIPFGTDYVREIQTRGIRAKGSRQQKLDYVKEIQMQGIREGVAVFENLPEGTYYIFETDANGNAYPMNVKQTEEGNVWTNKLDDETISQEVIIDGKEDSPAGKVGLYTQYYELKNNYYYAGTIYISMQVKNGEQEIDVPETFYAGIFSDKDGKNLYNVVKLENNGEVEAEVAIASDADEKQCTYYVYETDKEGKLIDKDTFGYVVSGEGKAELRKGNWKAEISLVNNKKAEPTVTPTAEPTVTPTAEPTVTPTAEPTVTPTAEPTVTPTAEPSEIPVVEPTDTPTVMPTNIPTDSKTDTTNAVRTGDDTPITEYLAVMLAAVLILLVGMVYWRGHRKHE